MSKRSRLLFALGIIVICAAGSSLFLTTTALAWQPRLLEDARLEFNVPTVVGSDRDYILGADENLVDLAYRSGIGYNNLVRANPEVDPWMPPAGQRITLPRRAIVPEPIQPGITINLAELRLYLIWEKDGQKFVRIYPVGIGREGRSTPPGTYQVANRAENPSWTPPPSIKEGRPELPLTVAPGPDNPLGDFWIGLSDQRLGIHGTNKPHGVGRHISSGCIRLYPRDIADLYHRAKVGMPVTIIDQPIKLGRREGTIYLEAHSFDKVNYAAAIAEVLRQKAALAPGENLDLARVEKALREMRGIPVAVSPEAPQVTAADYQKTNGEN